jgi:VIT1/CCC1 family predicted Fe2+/Mn2+ transporter
MNNWFILIHSLISGGGISWQGILIMGFANVVANGFSIGAGEYLSSKAHRDFVVTEKRREQWEYRNSKEGEIKQLTMIFHSRGMALDDANLVVRKMAEYEDFFVDIMVAEDLGLHVVDEDDFTLLKDSFVMFISFSILGSLPLLAYFAVPYEVISFNDITIIVYVFTATLLFSLGAIKSTFR